MQYCEFNNYIEHKKFQQIVYVITLHTACKLQTEDELKLLKNVDLMCGLKSPKSIQQIKLDDTRFIVTRDNNIVFHYDTIIDKQPVLRSKHTGLSYSFRHCAFNELCWLPFDESPIRELSKDVWLHISQYLSIDEKRSLCTVSKSFNMIFSRDVMWINDLRKIKSKLPLAYTAIHENNRISVKQQIFRYLLFVNDDEQFVDVFSGPVVKLYCIIMGVHSFIANDSSKTRRQKRQKNTIHVITNSKITEARLAVGFYDHIRQSVSAIFWVSVRGKLRFKNNNRKTDLTWSNVKEYLQHYRQKLIK